MTSHFGSCCRETKLISINLDTLPPQTLLRLSSWLETFTECKYFHPWLRGLKINSGNEKINDWMTRSDISQRFTQRGFLSSTLPREQFITGVTWKICSALAAGRAMWSTSRCLVKSQHSNPTCDYTTDEKRKSSAVQTHRSQKRRSVANMSLSLGRRRYSSLKLGCDLWARQQMVKSGWLAWERLTKALWQKGQKDSHASINDWSLPWKQTVCVLVWVCRAPKPSQMLVSVGIGGVHVRWTLPLP